MYKAIKENKIIAVNDSGDFPCLVYDEVVEDNQHEVADFVMVGSEFVLKTDEKAIDLKKKEVRDKRNELLEASDKYMISDFPITNEEREEWGEYREYLRNIPEAPDFPNVRILSFDEWKIQKGIEYAE